MPKAAKSADFDRGPFHRLSDSEILLFLSRTLRPQFANGQAPTVVAKLQSLKDILDRQHGVVADLPDGAGKDRMRQSVAKANELVAQIVEDLAGTADGLAPQPQR